MNPERIYNQVPIFSTELSDNDFRKVSKLIYSLCGINLTDGKKALVRARLVKRLRALKMGSIRQYIKYLESENGSNEMGFLVDVMTTNKTSFFREIEHFNFLGNEVLPNLKKKRLRFWTAACSSGEEPFSLSILLREKLPGIDSKDVRILATDISMQMLEKAYNGLYGKDTMRAMPPHYISKYFTSGGRSFSHSYKINDNVRSLVRLAWLNLTALWPMKGPFNVIFCRNVMIYFDKPTQAKLINRFWDILEPGGYLFVGHSEGLSSISHKFKYIKPAVYSKPE
jgi:chemotaxis protein methyltransferase CheR